jgi:hypothetical protein
MRLGRAPARPRVPSPGIEPGDRPYESRPGANSLGKWISIDECVEQESNLQGPKAGGLQPPGHANAQPTHLILLE